MQLALIAKMSISSDESSEIIMFRIQAMLNDFIIQEPMSTEISESASHFRTPPVTNQTTSVLHAFNFCQPVSSMQCRSVSTTRPKAIRRQYNYPLMSSAYVIIRTLQTAATQTEHSMSSRIPRTDSRNIELTRSITALWLTLNVLPVKMDRSQPSALATTD